MKSIGKRIRMYRRRKGFTQKGLAAKVHISHQQISLYELDRSIPAADTLVIMSDVLGVTPNDLLGYTADEDIIVGCNDDERALVRKVARFALELYREHMRKYL